MEPPARNCIVIVGPTASGKTTLGVQIARELNGEVLSADSRQVYRGMDIGTGKDLAEYETPEGTVPYHLIDIVNPTEVYSIFHYQHDFYRAFEEVTSRGRLPVVVGGTGLYVEAVLRKFPVPDVPADDAFREATGHRSLGDLVAELKMRSPELADRTVLDCKRRVVRSLEIAHHTEEFGKPAVNTTDIEFQPVVLLVEWSREELRDRIRRRLLQRLDEGMIDEVRRLSEVGIPARRYNLFGMEYKHIARYLRNEISHETMVEDLFVDINYLSRRQRTYFRGIQKRGIEAHVVPGADLDHARKILRGFRFVPGA